MSLLLQIGDNYRQAGASFVLAAAAGKQSGSGGVKARQLTAPAGPEMLAVKTPASHYH